MSAPSAGTTGQRNPPFYVRPTQPTDYCPVPQRLIAELHDTPLAVGLYTLVGRLYLINQTPIPLSVPDVMRYDPTLRRGAVIRAFNRLVSGGWLTEEARRGHKTRYTPTWGRVHGIPLPWQIGASCLGRPRHINRLCVGRDLLDVCMGKLTPHAVQTAVITRYVTMPTLSLADVGSYALTLAGLPHETPALRVLNIVKDGEARPLPSEQHLLAIMSQRPLLPDMAQPDTALTASGTRRLGLVPLPPPKERGSSQPLFFVPAGRIGTLIGPMIPSMIGHPDGLDTSQIPSTSVESRSIEQRSGITWESGNLRDSGIPPQPPTPLTYANYGGGIERKDNQVGRPTRAVRQVSLEVPDTEATRLLRTINVLPEQLLELAEMPIQTINAAIADGKARPGIRDLAGWVIKLLRTHRDYDWTITPPPPRPDSPDALREAFACYAVQQEAERHADLPDDQPWFPPPAPTMLNLPRDLTRLWNDVQTTLRLQLTRQEFNTWIRRAVLQNVNRGIATIAVPNATTKDGIERRYLAALRDLLTMHVGETVEVRVILNGAEMINSAESAAQQDHTCASVSTPSATPSTAADPARRPDWISVERWAGLPTLLRAALIGSILVGGAVRAKSLHLDRLLRTRYSHDLVELIEAAECATPEAD